MAYIGIDPNVGDITFQKFTGNGSATAFTLAQSVASGEAIVVTIGNVVQEPGIGAAYTAYGNTLTFSAAPANGDIITVRYFGRAVDQPLSYAMQLFKFVATASQTVFTGADNAGAILAFSGNDVDVYLNGVHLDSTDYTPTSGTTITLATAAALNDELVIRAYRAFSVTDTVSAASGGTFNGAVTFDAGANFGDNDKAVFGAGSDLQIFHNGSDSYVKDNGNGILFLQGSNAVKIIGNTAGAAILDANEGGGVHLYHNGSEKITTTSGGVDVTGTATVDQLSIDSVGAFGNFDSKATISTEAYFTGSDKDFRVKTTGGNVNHFVVQATTGNVGIGTDSPVRPLNIKTSDTISATLYHNSSSGTTATDGFFVGTSVADAVLWNYENGTIQFATNNTERMRIDSSGKLLVGTTSASSPFDGCRIAIDANSSDGIRVRSSGVPMRFIATGTSTFVGSISTTGSTTSYNTSSDYRLKENVVEDWDATTRLKQLNPVRFNFISDADTTVDGFLAHEVQDVVPEAITGTKDAVDDEGNPAYQGIDQSKLVPLLVKTIQELEARITALEAN